MRAGRSPDGLHRPSQVPRFDVPPSRVHNDLGVNLAHDIRDKSVLVTGAGRGIGKRLAMGFAEAGARVGLLARSQAELDLAKL